MSIEKPSNPEFSNPALREELLDMMEEDQKARYAYLDIAAQEEKNKLASEMDEIDKRNTERLKSIINECGFPKISEVGEDGSNAAWILAQHADLDVHFQKDVLKLMNELPEIEVRKSNIAFLTDRVLVNEGKPQKFGTQWWPGESGKGEMRPIEDIDAADQLRTEYGLPSLQEYSQRMKRKVDR